MKKVYFAASIRGGRDDVKIYSDLITTISKYAQVLTEHIGQADLEEVGEKHMTDKEIFDRDVAWLKSADAVIAEVTTTSLGVGYELGLAESLGKKVLLLYRPSEGKRLSAMLVGNGAFTVAEYSQVEEAEKLSVVF